MDTNKMQTKFSFCFTKICVEDIRDPIAKPPPFIKTKLMMRRHHNLWSP